MHVEHSTSKPSSTPEANLHFQNVRPTLQQLVSEGADPSLVESYTHAPGVLVLQSYFTAGPGVVGVMLLHVGEL